MNRRQFFYLAAGLSIAVFLAAHGKDDFSLVENDNLENAQDREEKNCEIFSRIIAQAKREGWASLPIGECMGKIGLIMVGTKYAAGTLEGPGPEICRVDLKGLDCVTFYESVLCMARVLKKGKTAFDDFVAEVTFTRYRGGKLTDYTSRLHYTSDWIYDNEQKKVVRNITREIGEGELLVKVFFMSKNPDFYPALKEFPEFIEKIADIEKEINERQHWYIPKKNVRKAEKSIQTGDIIAVATSQEGLDYGHTGLAYRDAKGKLRFLHASQKKGKVILDTELYGYIKSAEKNIGVTIVRPQDVNK